MESCIRVLSVGLCLWGCGSVGGSTDADVRAVACNGGTVDVLVNGNFDAADSPWRQEPPALLCGAPRITPHSGTTAACMGGMDGMTNTVSRDVPLPAGAASARLTGQICIATEETEAADKDVLAFDLVAGVASIGPLGQRTNQHGMASCDFTSFTLETPLSNDPPTATLRLQSKLDTGLTTSFFVDSLTLTIACQ